MASFVHDTVHYKESLRAFKTEQLRQEIPFLKEKVIPAFLRTLTKTIQKPSYAINILSVGAAEGQSDLFLIQELLDNYVTRKDGKIIYTVVEMNADFVASFQEKVKQNAEALKEVEFRWICDTFENVANGIDFVTKFDVIVFYHVLYYMDAEKALEKCMEDILKPGGCIFSVVQGDQDFTKLFFTLYQPKIKGLWKDMTLYSTRELEQLATDKEWKYESFAAPGSMDIQPVIEPDSKRGRLILDFFFQAQNVEKLLGQAILEEVLETLRGLRLKEGTSSEAEFRVPKHSGMIVIYRPC